MPRALTVSVVNWNTRDDLARCLESLRQASRRIDAEIVVVDNASPDGSAAMVRERFPDVRLLACAENHGFAAGNNLVLRQSRSDYALILNPDVRVTEGAINGMLTFLRTHPGIAGVGPALRGHDGRVQSAYYRRFPSRLQILLFHTTLEHICNHVPFLRRRYLEHDLRGRDPVPVDHLAGACMMVRQSALEDVGLLDPDYFLWFEDVDWGYRARQAGHQLRALPWVRVFHAGAGSLHNWSIDRRFWQFFRSYFRFLCKHRLEGLLRWSNQVIGADLLLKEWIARGRGLTGIRARRGITVDLPRALRAAIRDIVARHRQGELRRYTAADIWTPTEDFADGPQ